MPTLTLKKTGCAAGSTIKELSKNSQEGEMSLNVNLDYALADEITILNIKDMHQNILKLIKSLKDRKKSLKPFEKQDLKDHIHNKETLEKTLKYMMSHEDYTSYIKEQK